MPKHEPDAELYSRLLFPQKLGYPLFVPRLADDLPAARRALGVQIGDVGVVTRDGAFDPIFNIMQPADGALNTRGVPGGANYTPLVVADDVLTYRRMYPPSHRVSNQESKHRNVGLKAGMDATVGKAELSYERSKDAQCVAILTLPDGGSTHEHRRLRAFEAYARQHAHEWYSFVISTLGRKIAFGDLYLVTQVRRAASWKISVGQQTSGGWRGGVETGGAGIGSVGISGGINGTSGPVAEGEAGVPMSSWASTPRVDRPAGADDEDQTVFFAGFKVMLGFNARFKITGRARDIGDNKCRWRKVRSGGRSFRRTITNFFLSCCGAGSRPAHEAQATHPSDVLNEYILQQAPDAPAALTHDCIWASILEKHEALPQMAELIQRVLEKFELKSDATGAISPVPRTGESLDQFAAQQTADELAELGIAYTSAQGPYAEHENERFCPGHYD